MIYAGSVNNWSLIPAFRTPLEFAVVILPFAARCNGLNRIPMFSDLAIRYAEQIIERAMLACSLALTNGQNKIAFRQNPFIRVTSVVQDFCVNRPDIFFRPFEDLDNPVI